VYDVAVIGAGPAGAMLARLIGGSCKVLLIERRDLLEQKEKTVTKLCGGLIAPDAQGMLGKLGLGVPREVLVGPQLFTVRTIDFQSKLERYYQRHYINIDREKFDAWLVSLIPPSADIRCRWFFKSFERTGTSIRLRLKHNGKEYIEETKLLVGADGAFSPVRRALAPQIPQKKYLSIQEWFKVPENLPYFSVIFDRTLTDFYAWTIPKEEYLLVGAALSPQGKPREKFNLLKEKLLCYGFELKEPVKRGAALITRPQSMSQIYLGEGNIALLGEAAGWISPTSAEGLSYALRSALALARSLRENSRGYLQDYSRRTSKLKLNIVAKNFKAPFMYQPFLRRIVMGSGITAMKRQETEPSPNLLGKNCY
jgi:geranylgeranyl reductase